MICNGRDTSVNEMPDLSAQLCHLLSEQIAYARKGNLTQVERLFARTDPIVAAIARSEGALTPSSRADLRRLCDELAFVLQAQRDDVRGRLKRLRQVKRVLETYRERAERV